MGQEPALSVAEGSNQPPLPSVAALKEEAKPGYRSYRKKNLGVGEGIPATPTSLTSRDTNLWNQPAERQR